MKKFLNLFCLIALVGAFSSCSSDDDGLKIPDYMSETKSTEIYFIQNQKTLQAKEQYLLNNRIASVMGSFVLNWMKLDKKDQAQVLQVWKQNKHIISHVQKSNRYKTTILLFLMTWISPFYACR